MVDQFWRDFLNATGRDEATEYYECFHFELTEALANQLLALVLAGTKRATAGSLWSYEMEGRRLPAPGDLGIVTDWAGVPHCVIE